MTKQTAEEIPRRFVRIDKVLEILPVSRARLYQLADTEGLPHYRIGKAMLFDLEEVEAWIRAHRKRNGGGR